MKYDLEKLLNEGESETIDFKTKFKERDLKTISAFASFSGGTILIGVDDDGNITGVNNPDEEMEKISNKIPDILGISPEIRKITHKDKTIIMIKIEKNEEPISYKGKFYERIGNTTQKVNKERARKLRSKDVQWDSMTGSFKYEDIDEEQIKKFLSLAKSKGRLDYVDLREDIKTVLSKLGLIRNSKLTNGALLAFGDKPQKYFRNATVRVGKFKKDEILGDKWIEGNLFNQIKRTMEAIKDFINVRYEIKDVEREDIWDYPLDALREAVINALLHRDYFDRNNIQIKVYPDKIYFSNPGELPEGIEVEDLRKEVHDSKPRNEKLARIFYLSGYIEQWGTGTYRMIQSLKEAGLPEPEFESRGNFRVWFYKDIWTEEKLKSMDLNERQIKAVKYVKEKRRITNRDYRRILNVSNKTAYLDIKSLVNKGILLPQGGGRERYYVIKSNDK